MAPAPQTSNEKRLRHGPPVASLVSYILLGWLSAQWGDDDAHAAGSSRQAQNAVRIARQIKGLVRPVLLVAVPQVNVPVRTHVMGVV
jgi:hypothetical protein